MARTFAHVSITFRRTVIEEQTVEVAVAPELDAATQRTVAQQLATKRLKASGWEQFSATDPTIQDGTPPKAKLGVA